MKRFLLWWILFIAVLTAPLLHAAKAAEPSDRDSTLPEILVLNSYHPGYGWSDGEHTGVIDVLQGENKNWVPIVEYLDLKRLPGGRHLAELKKLFRLKHSDKKFSAIIAMDNPAVKFAIDNQEDLFRNAPIVFCGINNYTPSLLKGHPNVTGVAESIDLARTIELMLRLHPTAREIFVPHDYTVSSLAVRREIEALVPRFGARVRFRFSDPLTMEELLKELERLPRESLVLEIGFITDKSGRTFGMTEAVMLFFDHSPVPIYSTYQQRLGFGIVGGKLLSARHHGTNAGRIALRVLAGEKASAIPIAFESDSQFMFDYKVMNRFGIPLSALPENSVVINKPVSFYAAHRAVLQAATVIIVFLAAVIFLLTINIIQRRRSAIALSASEAKYYDLYENAPDMYLSVDARTATILGCNKTLVHKTGYAKEDIVGRSLYDIYHPDCKEDVERSFQELAATGEVRDSERKIICKDGRIIDISLKVSVVRDRDGKITHSRAVWHDITDRKKMEIRLGRLNDCFLRFGASPDDNINRLVAVCGELMNATCALYNRLGKDLLRTVGQWRAPAGFKPEDKPVGHICYDVIQQGGEHPLLVRNLQESPYAGTDPNILAYGLKTYLGVVVKWKQTAIGSLCVVYQTDIIPSNDDLRFMTIIASAIAVEEDRLQAEEALRQSEENFRRSMNYSPLGARILTEAGETIYANRAMLDIYGYDSLEEFISTPLSKRYTPESYSQFQIRRKKRRKGEDVPSEYEVSIVRKDGGVRRLHAFRNEVLWNGESRIQVIYQDITDRKRAEDALRESEERYRTLFARAVDGIFILSLNGQLVEVNESLARMHGYSTQEMLRMSLKDLDTPETALQAPERMRRLSAGEDLTFEVEHYHKDGHVFPLEVSVSLISSGGKSYVQCFHHDITERKQAEVMLHRSEENFRRFLEDSPLGVRIVTKEGETIYTNQAMLDIYGYDSVEELRAIPVEKRYTPESYAEHLLRKEKRKQGDDGPSEYNISIVRKGGEVRHLHVFRKEVLWNGARQFQVIYNDVTERKEAEYKLHQWQDLMHFIIKHDPNAIAVYDDSLRYIFVSERYLTDYNVKERNIIGRHHYEVFPEMPERWKMVHRRVLGGAIERSEEDYFERLDGSIDYNRWECRPWYNPDGTVGGMITYTEVITERKRAEDAVHASREQMRALAGRLQAVREEERTQIAREIHDELGGALTGLKIDFSLLTKAALKITDETVRTSLLAGMGSMIESIDATIHTVRRIAMELRPGVLDDLGLVAALEWQLKDFEKRTGTRCEFFPPAEDISLAADLSTALFRIFQEALTNVVRHSGATEVHVRLRVDADSIILEVEDNGLGIEKEKSMSSKSLGLLGMRERAQIFGGRITVTGTPGMGTTVVVEIPPVEKRKRDQDQEGDAG